MKIIFFLEFENNYFFTVAVLFDCYVSASLPVVLSFWLVMILFVAYLMITTWQLPVLSDDSSLFIPCAPHPEAMISLLLSWFYNYLAVWLTDPINHTCGPSPSSLDLITTPEMPPPSQTHPSLPPLVLVMATHATNE